MKHLGDITKIKGGAVPMVNVIIGGSPCQDLSIAGKRAGLAGERSGLFMEQIRIIKEMREHDADSGREGKDIRPRFMVWENVPGAFSSNKGEDFGAVLQETIRVIYPQAPAVPVPKNGWPTAGCIHGGGLRGRWSVAWRVFDAQFWGVPQRRRRIALVADFAGMSAPEILFERESVSRDSAPCGASWERTAPDAQDGTSTDDSAGFSRIAAGFKAGQGVQAHSIGWEMERCPTLSAEAGGNAIPSVCYSFDSLASNSMKSANPHSGCREVEIAKTLDTTDPNPSKNQGGIAVVQMVPVTLKMRSGCEGGGKGALWQNDMSVTLATNNDQYLFQPVYVECADDCSTNLKGTECYDARGNGSGNVVPTLTGDHQDRVTDYTAIVCKGMPVYCIQGNCIDRADTAGCNGRRWTQDVSYTLNTIDRPAVCYKATYQSVTGPLMANTHPGCYSGQDAYTDMFVVGKECPAVGIGRDAFNSGSNAQFGMSVDVDLQPPLTAKGPGAVCAAVDFRNFTEDADRNGTLQAKSDGGISYNLNNCVRIRYIVRRLTPLECERLQGFPDGWTAIGPWTKTDTKGKRKTVEVADSARYKALGNSIAIPPWYWVLVRLSLACGVDHSMASLFDGIGGFPLIWESINGKGSCLWASEIEDFPIAVTKVHFPEEE